ncbi:hypothetical protein CYPRO_1480 [Cyclonatronum proteinivorum]|uniref:Uncharacterized protein n=1 Tax=Cyclonatronum proteinivorum TaxID=1457365 RepID=A0A345UJT4_9BACT|nr:hypothetical protein CYPRO_1480 [Cyclonatronum proteinivorum]
MLAEFSPKNKKPDLTRLLCQARLLGSFTCRWRVPLRFVGEGLGEGAGSYEVFGGFEDAVSGGVGVPE